MDDIRTELEKQYQDALLAHIKDINTTEYIRLRNLYLEMRGL